MFIVVTGGSGSGKSEFAENLAVQIHKEQLARMKNFTSANQEQRDVHIPALYYVATMHPYDNESRNRIRRHRQQRDGKGFVTLEQATELEKIETECSDILLLEDLSNLLANEMYLQTGRIKARDAGMIPQMERAVLSPILQLVKQMESVVLVTNEIFSDGMEYEEETIRYLELLGSLNQHLAKAADSVVEVVCGIPVWQKQIFKGKDC